MARKGVTAVAAIVLLVAPPNALAVGGTVETGTCQAGAQPLLWVLTSGAQNVYIVGSHHLEQEEVEPVAPSIMQAVGCADIAYFSTACTPGEGGLGHYMEHCKNYPISDRLDALSMRLTSQEVQGLQQALNAMANSAAPGCSAQAAALRSAASSLPSKDYRRSLRYLYLQATKVLDGARCSVHANKEAAASAEGGGFEGWLREQFGTARPTFGLEDIGAACKLIQGSTVAQDVALASVITQKFMNPHWRSNYTAREASLAQALKCGDLSELALMKDMLHADVLAEKNPVLVNQIISEAQANPERNLLVVLRAAHFLDFSSLKSAQTLLGEAGYNITRLSMTGLTCQKSTYEAPGAKDLGLCLLPPGVRQPESCTKFMTEWQLTLGEDKMRGRTKEDVGNCERCYTLNESCSCNFGWSNTSEFKSLCENTLVNGTRGQVLQLDLTRNPGSHRLGPGLAEKTVTGLKQNCYAETCDLQLLQESATRNWYKSDPDLNVGVVTLSPPHAGGNNDWSTPYVWVVLAVVAAFAAASAAMACFILPKTKKTKNTKRNVCLVSSEAEESQQEHWEEQQSQKHHDEAEEAPVTMPHWVDHPQDRKDVRQGLLTDSQQPAAASATTAPLEPSQAAYDTTLLKKVMEARHQLEDAGYEAVRDMQMQTLQGMTMQAMQSGIVGVVPQTGPAIPRTGASLAPPPSGYRSPTTPGAVGYAQSVPAGMPVSGAITPRPGFGAAAASLYPQQTSGVGTRPYQALSQGDGRAAYPYGRGH
mmetsp:Transcript_73927/g.186297  ORF Transcript_73927/g.186297 Transcript_73927/m.186297 type:complete len:763 (+) Transcript_73927:37-2325(+)